VRNEEWKPDEVGAPMPGVHPTDTDAARPPKIITGHDIMTMADAAIGALAGADVFTHAGELCEVVDDARGAHIQVLAEPRLAEMLSRLIEWVKISHRPGRPKNGELPEIIQVPCRPPTDVVKAVGARGVWPGVRPLSAVVGHPVLRPSGELLTTAGYDAETHVMLVPDPSLCIEVPDAPTKKEADAAVARLLGLVSDFPFEQDKHKAAYLCGMLTPMARPAIDGPTPFNFIDATVFGSGKTMLVDIIGRMYESRSMPRRVPPTNGAEWQKVMLTVVRSGDPLVLLDNIKGKLGGEALEAVLTGDVFRGRILGVSKDGGGETRAIWYGTGNNATLTPDMVRRSIHVRLKSDLENPESRREFEIPNLMAHVSKTRSALLTDVAIILRAYITAERPKVEVREMGSYESWTEQVRHPLAWLGLSDAAETQEELADNADQDTAELRILVRAWGDMHEEKWVTCRELLDSVKPDKDSEGNVMALADDAAALRDAIVGFCQHNKGGVPAAHALAMRLTKVRDRVVSGVSVQTTPRTKKGKEWRVATPPKKGT
jgi:hypothetical protein